MTSSKIELIIIKKTKKQSSSIEELASLEYTSIYANDMTKSEEEIMSGVVQKLNEKGYTTIPDTTENNIIATGFMLSEEYIELVPTTETFKYDGKKYKVGAISRCF